MTNNEFLDWYFKRIPEPVCNYIQDWLQSIDYVKMDNDNQEFKQIWEQAFQEKLL